MQPGLFIMGDYQRGVSLNKRFYVWVDGKDIAHDFEYVVKCKDCKHAMVNENHPDKPLICCLTKMCGTTSPDWFCADGERG